MTLSLMLAGLLIGALLAAGAAVVHHAERSANRPVRWIWATMLVATAALTLALPTRSSDAPALTAYTVADTMTTEVVGGAERSTPWWQTGRELLRSASSATSAPLAMVARAVSGTPGDRAAAVVWAAGSTCCAALLLLTYRRMQRRRDSWPAARLLGERVRLSDDAGPAVVGLRPMEIVVPSWILARSHEEQRLVLAHERQHVDARDPWLLLAACAVVSLMPWNPFLWYGLSRLRLAVELDCDRRVLQRGATPLTYGQLLLELSAQPSTLGTALPALAYSTSHLERRLLAMTTRPARFAAPRRVAGALVAGVALLAACESKLPTSAEIDAMDAKSATAQASRLALTDSSRTEYVVDGRRVSATEAQGLAASQITSIEVVKDAANAPQVRLRTVRGTDTMTLAASRLTLTDSTITGTGDAVTLPGEPTARGRVRYRVKQAATDTMVAVLSPSRQPLRAKEAFDGLFIIDGKIVNPETANALSPDRIASIEVLKSAAATKRYSDPRAAKGVILITTKR